MSNEEVSRRIREIENGQNLLNLVYTLSLGKCCDILKPPYVSMASQKFHMPVSEVETNTLKLKEIGLIDVDGRKLRLREEAKDHIPQNVKKEFEY